jgi:uroporphyrinogen decarboxylase
MNGHERIRAALEGRRPDVTPVMLHNFMMAAAESGVAMSRYRKDPAEAARCHIEAVEKYAYDGIVIDIDTATLAGAVGAPVAFPDDEPALCKGPALASLEQARDLAPPDIDGYWGVQAWLETTRRVKDYFGDQAYVRGNCDQCPFSLAASIRGAAGWMLDLMDPEKEEDAHRLLRYATSATARFVELMAGAGADMTSNGDSPAGPSVVSPAIYRKFALPYEGLVAETAHRLGRPYLLHICGKTEPILEDMVASGADALELDAKTGVLRARDALRGRATFVGNLDPTLLAMGTPAAVEKQTRELLAAFGGEPRFILNAGCAIPATTPPENLRAMIRTARVR